MKLAPYRIHKMIQDLMRDTTAAAAFAHNPEPAFEAYGITEAERVALRSATIEELVSLGVHPNLQLKLRRLQSLAGQARGPGPLDHYLSRLLSTK